MSLATKIFGHTGPAAIELLEPAVFDVSDQSELFGKTESPINVLPNWAIDMNDSPSSHVLVLTFRLRPNAIPSAVTFDLFAVYAVLNRYELNLGGSGLIPNETQSDLATANGIVRLVLSATEPDGASAVSFPRWPTSLMEQTK